MPDLLSQLPHDTVVVTVPVDVESLPGIIVINLVKAKPSRIKGEFGIDVSRHQGVIDWDKVAAVPTAFAGIRATLGASGKDDQFKRNWSEAKRVGIQRMAYHYFINNTSALPQLDNFLNSLGDDLGELPLILDIEPRNVSTNPATTVYETINKNTNTESIRLWLTECKSRTGRDVAIYGNAWSIGMCTTYPNGPIMDWIKNYPLWLAQHTTAPAPRLPAPWTKYMAWQYSQTGRVAGVAKVDGTPVNVDLNRWGEL